MPARKHVEDNRSTAMLATKRSTGVTPEMNLREYVTYRALLIRNKVDHFGIEIQRKCHQRSKSGVPVTHKKTHDLLKYFKNLINCSYLHYNSDLLEKFKCPTMLYHFGNPYD